MYVCMYVCTRKCHSGIESVTACLKDKDILHTCINVCLYLYAYACMHVPYVHTQITARRVVVREAAVQGLCTGVMYRGYVHSRGA